MKSTILDIQITQDTLHISGERKSEAKDKLLKLVGAAENQLMIIPVAKDSYGRTVAEVMARGQGDTEISFQEELLKIGLAKTRLGGIEYHYL